MTRKEAEERLEEEDYIPEAVIENVLGQLEMKMKDLKVL